MYPPDPDPTAEYPYACGDCGYRSDIHFYRDSAEHEATTHICPEPEPDTPLASAT